MFWSFAAAAAFAGVRLETGVGVDTNVRRIEGGDGQSDLVYRLVLDAEKAFRPSRRTRIGLGYQAGARHFQEVSAEDALFQRFSGTFTLLAAKNLSLGVNASANDRTTRNPRQPRDYTRVAAGPRLDVRLGDWVLGLRCSAEQLFFKPDDDFTATGLGGDLSLNRRVDAWSFGVHAGVLSRRFQGPRLVREGTSSDGSPFLVQTDARREDLAWRGGASVRYVAAVLGDIQYLVTRNDSNTYGGTFTRHLVQVSGTAEAPLGVLASLKMGLQRNVYDDPQFVQLGGRIEDEGRSAISVRLERPFAENWSVVGTGGWWFSPAESGPEYARQSVILGIAFND